MAMKRTLSIIVAALLCLTLFAGCASKNLPAATVGDKVITVTQLENMYINNSTYSAYNGFTLSSDEGVEGFQDYLLNLMVESRLKQYKAEQSGIELSAEELAQAKATADASYEETYQSFITAAEEAGASDIRAYANQLFTDALSRNKTTVRQMKKEYLSEAKGDMLIAKHREQLLEGVEAGEEDLKAMYDEELAAQQEEFDEDSAAYFTQDAYSMYGMDYVPLYIPADFFRVRQILVEDRATAEDILNRLHAGEDFEELLAEHNTDPGMESYPEGYLVGEGASFIEEFLTAALALKKEGDLSEIVESSSGFHIIKRLADETGGVLPYGDVQERFEAYAKSKFIEDYYAKLLESWKQEEGLVTYYEENFRGIGKAG